MLAVQVNYWQMRETQRHNLVSEEQNAQSLKLQERDVTTREKAQAETGRHNLVVEEQGWATIAETSRHNMAIEALTGEQNKIAWYNAESNRMNALTNRENLAVNWYNAATNRMGVNNSFTLGLMNVEVARTNANTNIRNADTNAYNAQISEQRMKNDYQINLRRLDVDKQQANTAAYNADINARNAEIRQQEADIQQYRADIQASMNQAQINQWGIENGINAVRTAVDIFKAVDQSTLNPRNKRKKGG